MAQDPCHLANLIYVCLTWNYKPEFLSLPLRLLKISSRKEYIHSHSSMIYNHPYVFQVMGWEEGTKCQGFKDSCLTEMAVNSSSGGHLREVRPA